jgi:flavin reductase (DIM6/NTAB) family NADH-FMN oxidoreductase RutF
MHFYEPRNGHGLRHDPFNAIIAPRPIGWISTCSEDGKPNLAPYSFFNAFNYTPPLIGFSSQGDKDSVRNARATGEFVWNLVSRPLAEAMNQSCAPVPHGVNEFELAGLETAPSRLVKVPRVAASLVTMECRVTQIIHLQNRDGTALSTWLTMGEVIAVHIDDSLIEEGVYQTAKAQPVMRGGGAGDYFTIVPDHLFRMSRPA